MDNVSELFEGMLAALMYAAAVFCILSVYTASERTGRVINGVINNAESAGYAYSYTDETVKGSSIADIIISEAAASLYIDGELLDSDLISGIRAHNQASVSELYRMLYAAGGSRYGILREYDESGIKNIYLYKVVDADE